MAAPPQDAKQATPEQQRIDLCLKVARPLHQTSGLLIMGLHDLLGKADGKEKYVQMLKQLTAHMIDEVQTLLHESSDELCSNLVKQIRCMPEYIIFTIEFGPNAKVDWTCSLRALDGEEKEEPWHAVVVRELIKSAELVNTDPTKALAYGCGLEHGSLSITDAGEDVILYDHFTETPDGWESSGYSIALSKIRFARILKGMAAQIQKAYST